MELFKHQKSTPVWFSFENKTGARGSGALENHGAKGHPFEPLANGEEKVLCDISGSGVVRHIWLTLEDRSEHALRNIYIRMYWDDAKTPAVNVPIGDFFCVGNGKMIKFENEFFSSPEGRSFVCIIPMPFRKHARVTLFNDKGADEPHLYYEVALTLEEVGADDMYFHAVKTVSDHLPICEDIPILPKTAGPGRFLGTNVCVTLDPMYAGTWFGEGEVKIYLDGEKTPSLVGTGTEDYIGTAWGQACFINRYTGCTLMNDNETAFYRFHVPDPVFFDKSCYITIQDMGGAEYKTVKHLFANTDNFIPISSDCAGDLLLLFKKDNAQISIDEEKYNWVNFYRRDKFEITAYYYMQTDFI